MGKKTARRPSNGPATKASAGPSSEVPVVGGREPCPCGSGRRYKACHGRAAGAVAEAFVARPFEGLPGECDWVALREIVPAATAALQVTEDLGAREVTLATVLPMAWPELVREDGTVFVGLQVPGGSGDPSRDVAEALLRALEVDAGAADKPAPRLQDLLDLTRPLEVTVHEGFDFWFASGEERSPEVVASMERANEAVVPTVRLASVEAAYWCDIRDRRHLRWVMPHDEDTLLDALARLHVADGDRLGEGTRYIGSFRAHGVLVPVWDLPAGTSAEEVEEPAVALAARLDEALAETSPLRPDQRRARDGLRSRQLTLR